MEKMVAASIVMVHLEYPSFPIMKESNLDVTERTFAVLISGI